MDRANIEKIARRPEDRLLLAKLYDKIDAGIRQNIPANTCFLSPAEQEMARFLFGNTEGLVFFGGRADAERKMLCYLPDYLEQDSLMGAESPVVCLRAAFHAGENLTHRDFLGALMGAGVARETVGDIYPGEGSCDFFVTGEIAPYLLQNLTSAGRTRLSLTAVPLAEVKRPEEKVAVLKDTLASLRLDCVVSAGFRVSRTLAASYIAAGRVAVDGIPRENGDRPVPAGAKISVRGLGKILLAEVGGQTKKGRVSVTIHRYL